ncbi:DUF1476 domain-containing protein [Polymorphobacter sp.]|uniref:DUF1476 domain-containing protein n=1 Tax=Polymorphobacter sp. TaxID=1909290 RepID=UPI003F6FB1D8
MNSFENREAAFENRFAHDAERQFRILARRNRLIGEWAAARLGLGADAADAYARSVVVADLEEAGDEDVIRKLVADLAATGTDEAAVRAELLAATKVAQQQVEEA